MILIFFSITVLWWRPEFGSSGNPIPTKGEGGEDYAPHIIDYMKVTYV